LRESEREKERERERKRERKREREREMSAFSRSYIIPYFRDCEREREKDGV
jgi:hypothetical protein